MSNGQLSAVSANTGMAINMAANPAIIEIDIQWVDSGVFGAENGYFWVRKNGEFSRVYVGKSREKIGIFPKICAVKTD